MKLVCVMCICASIHLSVAHHTSAWDVAIFNRHMQEVRVKSKGPISLVRLTQIFHIGSQKLMLAINFQFIQASAYPRNRRSETLYLLEIPTPQQ